MNEHGLFKQSFTRRRALQLAVRAGVAGAAAPLLPFLGRSLAVAASASPTPQWDAVFRTVLGSAMGYTYVVAQNGQVVASGAAGYARSPYESVNPSIPLATTTRLNLASLSKAITGIAVMTLVQRGALVLSNPFLPYIQSQLSGTPGSGVNTVTIADLLTMKSGLANNGTLYFTGTIWAFLSPYLQQALAGTPGVTYNYSNTNFTILQAVIDQIVPTLSPAYVDYADYVTRAVLAPLGIATTQFSPTADPAASATLCYQNASDTRAGKYWPTVPATAAGGWIAPVSEAIKVLTGLRGTAVLTAQSTTTLLTNGYGWYATNGVYGTYYQKTGDLNTGAANQAVQTALFRFTNGYDAVLLINAETPWEASALYTDDWPWSVMMEAFEAQGTQVTATFATAPSVLVTDGNGNPLASTPVTFSAPATGASGTFQTTHANTQQVLTNSTGIATASAFTANGQVGSYQITTNAAGSVFPSGFFMTNGAPNTLPSPNPVGQNAGGSPAPLPVAHPPSGPTGGGNPSPLPPRRS